MIRKIVILYSYLIILYIRKSGHGALVILLDPVIPEMRIWSILLIKSDLKWCIHLSRSLYLSKPVLYSRYSKHSEVSSHLHYILYRYVATSNE